MYDRVLSPSRPQPHPTGGTTPPRARGASRPAPALESAPAPAPRKVLLIVVEPDLPPCAEASTPAPAPAPRSPQPAASCHLWVFVCLRRGGRGDKGPCPRDSGRERRFALHQLLGRQAQHGRAGLTCQRAHPRKPAHVLPVELSQRPRSRQDGGTRRERRSNAVLPAGQCGLLGGRPPPVA